MTLQQKTLARPRFMSVPAGLIAVFALRGVTFQDSESRRSALLDGLVRAGALAAVAVVVLAGSASPAFAGRWIDVSCKAPSSAAVSSEGWRTSALGSVGPYSGDSNGCASGGVMEALVSGEGPQGAYEGPAWEYTAPEGSTVAGGSITAALSTPHGQAWIATPNPSYDSADIIANCQYNLACGEGGVLHGTFAISHPGGTHIYAAAVCVAPKEGERTCPAFGGIDASIAIESAQIELANSSTPTGSGFAGTLLATGSRGNQELSFIASDARGPGVYTVTVQVDSKTVYSGTPASNGGACVPLGSAAGVLMFDHEQPCPASEAVDVPVETAGLKDGSHTLKVTVTDAAGNSSVIYDAQISTLNAPQASAGALLRAPSQVFAGSAVSAQPGSWSAAPGAGTISYSYAWEDCDAQGNNCTTIEGAENASYTPTPQDVGHTLRATVTATDNDGHATSTTPASTVVLASQGNLGAGPGPGAGPAGPPPPPPVANGAFASEDALLYLGVPAHLTRSYAHRAFQLNGRLLNKEGHPIIGATLQITQQSTAASQTVVIATVKTGEAGQFSVLLPAGPSRTISVDYQAFSSDTLPAAHAQLTETVPAEVTLHANHTHTPSHGSVVFTGTVAGPIPHGGVIVQLAVYYHHAWQIISSKHTNSQGRYTLKCAFHGSEGRYPFRTEIPAGLAAFPYTTGKSRILDIYAR